MLPPVVKKARVVSAVITCLAVLLLLVGTVFIHPVPGGAYAAYAAALLIPYLCVGIRERRWRRKLLESHHRLCLYCGHSLTGLGETGICPECGRAFIIQGDREIWAAAGFSRHRRS